MKNFKSTDVIDNIEKEFPIPKLLKLEYFKEKRDKYYDLKENGWQLDFRNYLNLLIYLSEIYKFNKEHANSYSKKLNGSGNNDYNNCEAVFSEIIVYRYYIRLFHEGLIKSIQLYNSECDLIIERLDGTLAYFETFCIMPNFKNPTQPGEVILNDIKTHTQNAMASIRQKLLRKINKQKQLIKKRENYAIIEINSNSIAGDFAIQSSLSGGYKINLNKDSNEIISEGYDWEDSVFKDESTKHLKGIIYYNLGDYESRKFIYNPLFCF